MPDQYQPGTLQWINEALFLDADLSVLSWDPETEYENYAWGIWKEYEFYGRQGYCEGRSNVLDRMLTSKPSLYFHPKIQAKYEEKARSNVRKEITSLKTELQNIVAQTAKKLI